MYTLCNRPFAVLPESEREKQERERESAGDLGLKSSRELLKYKLLIERVIKKLLSVALVLQFG